MYVGTGGSSTYVVVVGVCFIITKCRIYLYIEVLPHSSVSKYVHSVRRYTFHRALQCFNKTPPSLVKADTHKAGNTLTNRLQNP